ncbi:helix-turn-helix domain-containing protein [Chitinophaga sedimenti]|uniref:helix-turn-helix domain-containing protein n=1 Tax=Chitinophaga sedimenti TaxID=2033606 RepID=UPI002005B846|nr:helix-turn-helix transcriptional regulator [Chitinophaga sedimenti]MCK7556570.1 helix-turn-helix domain-containing protein [Chitinophaga sedimenti]
MNVGKSIKRLRELKDFSQDHMAKQLGMSVTAYGNIERNQVKNLPVTRLAEIAAVLEIDICVILRFDAKTDLIIGAADKERPADPALNADALSELRVVLTVQRKANEKMLEALNLITLLLKQKI